MGILGGSKECVLATFLDWIGEIYLGDVALEDFYTREMYVFGRSGSFAMWARYDHARDTMAKRVRVLMEKDFHAQETYNTPFHSSNQPCVSLATLQRNLAPKSRVWPLSFPTPTLRFSITHLCLVANLDGRRAQTFFGRRGCVG